MRFIGEIWIFRSFLLACSFKYDIKEFRMLRIYSKHKFGNWTQSNKKMKVCVISHFEPSHLRHEMIVTSLDWVQKRDRGTVEQAGRWVASEEEEKNKQRNKKGLVRKMVPS